MINFGFLDFFICIFVFRDFAKISLISLWFRRDLAVILLMILLYLQIR